MKLRRRKGATFGLVAVSVLVIIMIGVGCFFLAKICGGSREVTNATDAGTLSIARGALRSQEATVVCPPPAFPNDPGGFKSMVDQKYETPGLQPAMTLYTYNRAVAGALLVALNAQQEGTPLAASNASTVYNELTALGQSLTTKLQTQGTLAGKFSSVISNNNGKMFGNNAISEVAYNSKWMKQGGSTNIWFYQSPIPNGPSTIPSTANLAALNLTSPNPLNFTPQGGGAVNAYQNKYMVGYSPISVAGFAGTFIGVPVFPQQNPHLVSATDFTSSPSNFTPPAGGATPPNAFSVQAQSLESKSSTLGGSLACAIVGCSIGGVDNRTSPVHFGASLPGGYIMISNRSAANPPGGWGNPTIYDDSNSIFNHELNAQGIEGDIMSVQSSGGQYVFYDDQSSAAPSSNGTQVVNQWASYNSQGNPAAPATWTYGGSTMTGPPSIPPNIFVADASGNAVASSGSSTPASINQAAVLAALQGIGSAVHSEDCMNQMNSPPYYPVDAACGGSALNGMTTAYNRGGTGPGSGTASPQMFSNVDMVKASIINAFHSRSIPLTLGPYIAGGLGGAGASPPASGMGCYKANLTDPEIASAPTSPNTASRWTSVLSSPLEYTSPGESQINNGLGTDYVGTTVYAYLNQISGCALQYVIPDLTQRCCEIQPTTTQNDVMNLLKNSPPLYMNTTLYICKANPQDPTSGLTWAGPGAAMAQPTTFVAGAAPDGTNVPGPTSSSDCKSVGPGYPNGYGLNGGSGTGGLIDSKSLDGVSGADNNLHDQPFMNESGSLDAQDHADFILGSGYQNVLGKLDFYQTLTSNGGVDQFSRPN